MDLVPFLEPIRAELAEVERLLQETAARAAAPLGPGLAQVLLGGKRLRPALVILAGRLFAPTTPQIHGLATALDLLHASSLIHDDVVDAAPLRRGRAALHTVWPPAAAVLAGDYLLGEAMALVAELEQRTVSAFARLLQTVCAGEIAEMLGDGNDGDLRTAYARRIEGKTASLFTAAVGLAGALAGADGAQLVTLRGYGRELGMAYQIVDDVLDLTASEAELGKPAAGDLKQGLVTLPVVCYLETHADASDLVRAVLAGRRDEALVQAAVAAIRASGAIEQTLAEARAHVQRAQAALRDLPECEARRMLDQLAGYVVNRRH